MGDLFLSADENLTAAMDKYTAWLDIEIDKVRNANLDQTLDQGRFSEVIK